MLEIEKNIYQKSWQKLIESKIRDVEGKFQICDILKLIVAHFENV